MWKIGVFIDADNVSFRYAKRAIQKLRRSGRVRFIKAYGNWVHKDPAWRDLVNQYGVQTTQRYSISKSKNATDIALTVDATASLFGSLDFNTLAVVSSDCDFLPLMQLANSHGKRTIGLGLQSTSPNYQKQCSEFYFLEEVHDEPKLVAVAH